MRILSNKKTNNPLTYVKDNSPKTIYIYQFGSPIRGSPIRGSPIRGSPIRGSPIWSSVQ